MTDFRDSNLEYQVYAEFEPLNIIDWLEQILEFQLLLRIHK